MTQLTVAQPLNNLHTRQKLLEKFYRKG